jgi:nucleoside-diphosphate-sugar epimerase
VKETILVTGANGFVGRALVARLVADGHAVRAAVRRTEVLFPPGVRIAGIGNLDKSTDWRECLEGATAVVHCAARVHRLHDTADDALAECRRMNRDATAALAEQAASRGVRRFVFLSSIKVNGEATSPGQRFRADDDVAPVDPYGVSKWEAEQRLAEIGARTGLDVVILRPPLVYGPGVRANFLQMMKAVDLGLPLPFGAIANRRSLIALENLVDLIALALRHPVAPGRTFLVSDGEDLSTTDLLRRIASALGRSSRLLPVPEALLRRAFALVGRSDLGIRLCNSLEVDIDGTRRALDWKPAVGMSQALVDTAQHYLAAKRQRGPVTG